MQQKDFTEFLKDEKFIRWIVNPNEESDHFWKNWIASHPERKEDVELARNFLSSLEYKYHQRLDDVKYKEGLYNLMELHEAELTKKRLDYVMVWRSVGVAAMIILSFFIGIQLQKNDKVSEEAIVTREVIKQTDYGQKQIIRLPDGSVVHLNVGSKLTFQEPFSEDNRTVDLMGEAFFEVARDEHKPFIIHTGKLSTKVLGTSFNVRAYPDEQNIAVSVETGKVQVYSEVTKDSVVLFPDDQAVYKNNTMDIIVAPYDHQIVMGWRDGIIHFQNEPLSNVITKLERIYGVEFTIANHDIRLQEKYNGVYKNAPLERILQGISFAAGFDYELNGKTVTLKSKNE
ncbi:MAG: FecR family protein [Bacteroidota bacterium]